MDDGSESEDDRIQQSDPDLTGYTRPRIRIQILGISITDHYLSTYEMWPCNS